MNTDPGHLIRIVGLVIEMFGVWGVFNSNGAKDSARLQLPGGNEIPVAWLAVGIGFVLGSSAQSSSTSPGRTRNSGHEILCEPSGLMHPPTSPPDPAACTQISQPDSATLGINVTADVELTPG